MIKKLVHDIHRTQKNTYELSSNKLMMRRLVPIWNCKNVMILILVAVSETSGPLKLLNGREVEICDGESHSDVRLDFLSQCKCHPTGEVSTKAS